MNRRWVPIAVAGAAAIAATIVVGSAQGWALLPWRGRDRWTPTPDPNGWYGAYVPTDLLDAIRELDRTLPRRMKNEIRTIPQGGTSGMHFGFGLTLRNSWGLWRHSRLAQYFEARGVLHPDDMSAIVLEAYWAHLHGQPVDPTKFVYARTRVPAS